jgi:hypothetical protein
MLSLEITEKAPRVAQTTKPETNLCAGGAFVSWSPVAGHDSSSAYFFVGCGGAGGCSLLGGTMLFMRM